MSSISLSQRGAVWIGAFSAMASPCEVHIEARSRKKARHLVEAAYEEAIRIEKTFSRYRQDNVVHQINTSRGETIKVDQETGRLLDFADECFQLSNGLFDITSGVLRKVWQFDGGCCVPKQADIDALLPSVGWDKVHWQSPHITLPEGMQIDLGGIGKEYAVDRVVRLLRKECPYPFLINFGGDLHASAPPVHESAWIVGIESARNNENHAHAVSTLGLQRGAMTTSGDARRYVLSKGIRYGHVLNPKNGWPAANAPASVTVAGDSCLEAGVLSTLAILKGDEAETFLDEQDVTYWVQR